MSLIQKKYRINKDTPSDINEHLDVIFELSKQCDTLVEMGVRWVVSTWAMLASKPKKMISYDISYHDKTKIDEVIKAASEEGIDYQFILSDVLQIDIDGCDLLFIDTLHTYSQLRQELEKHAKFVNKFIVLHDTETFGNIDENVYQHASSKATLLSGNVGLKNAISDFLTEEGEGKNWKIKHVYTNNNGLTVLERNP
jgi:hypothetical protein